MIIKRLKLGEDIDIPKNVETKVMGKEYVGWGEDNLFPDKMIELFYRSSYQGGIVKGKVNYLVGSGFEYKKSPEADAFVANGVHDKTLQDVVRSCALNLELFDGFAIKIVRDRLGKLSYIDTVNLNHLRTNYNKTVFYYSDDWTRTNQTEEDTNYKEYPAYDKHTNDPVSILYYANESMSYKTRVHTLFNDCNSNVYPSPTYLGGIQDIMSTIEMSAYHYYELRNSFKAGVMISFNNGEPDDKTKRQIEQDLKDMVTPTENTGGMFIAYNDSKETAPDILQLNGNDLHERYILTEKEIKSNIFVAHSVTTPLLFGIKTEGQLGGTTELEVGFEIFVETYVKERQNQLQMVINLLAVSLGVDLQMQLNEPKLPFTNVEKEVSVDVSKEVPQQQFSKQELEEMEQKFLKLADELGTIVEPKKVIFSEVATELLPEYEGNRQEFAISPLEARFLQIYLTNTDVKQIADQLKLPYRDILEIYDGLERAGYLKDGVLTIAGINLIKSMNKTFPVQELYRYAERPDAPPLVAGGESRLFCRTLMLNMSLGKRYSRADIEKLNALTPLGDVFRYRGGWYTNPDTHQHEKGCRHDWYRDFVIG